MPQETKATTVREVRDDQLVLDTTQIGGGLVAATLALVSGALYLRRRLSRDGMEMVKDRAESDLVKTLQEERDKAMTAAAEAWATRTSDAQLIGELTVKVQHLTDINQMLRNEIAEVRAELQMLRTLLCTNASSCENRRPMLLERAAA